MDIVERLRQIDFTFWYSPIGPDENFEPIEIGKMSHEAADEIERLREALLQWDALIEHTYNGSRQAMSDMTDAAHNTAYILYGDPPWPDTKSCSALQQKDTE